MSMMKSGVGKALGAPPRWIGAVVVLIALGLAILRAGGCGQSVRGLGPDRIREGHDLGGRNRLDSRPSELLRRSEI